MISSCVSMALLQEEADVSNQRARIENSWKTAVNYLKNKLINEKLKEQLATAKRRLVSKKTSLKLPEQVQKLLANYQVVPRNKRNRKFLTKPSRANSFDRLDKSQKHKAG